ncbi:hypothetical protein [Janthinobacterium sp. BJB401]|uniref:hypothetical protein n=1 Tax=Janthinobacterium sp. BJB401 TaxID=2745934 RepID=UPI0015962B4D|nr:hypothetical protein [Janthinobacterium sp. BJB401]NVI85378.1 hypothetical protein [Janthinobacterium sp. BJB401]
MKIDFVTEKDFDGLEAENFNPLYTEVTTTCPGIIGQTLWEKILKIHNLQHFGDGPTMVANMNQAISIWNQSEPNDEATIKAAYGV